MRIIYLFLIGILFPIGLYAQDKVAENQPALYVVFKRDMNQDCNFRLVKDGYEQDGRLLLSKREKQDGSIDLTPVHEWWAWLLYRTLPEDIKQLLDLSPRYRGTSFGIMNPHLYSYGNVEEQAVLTLWFNDVFEVVQVKLEFIDADLFESFSEEQLHALCTEIAEYGITAKDVFRCLSPLQARAIGDDHKKKIYSVNVYVNGALKWGEKCRNENREHWETIDRHFDSVLQNMDRVVVNSRTSVDTVSMGHFNIVRYSDALLISPKEFDTIMDTFFMKGEEISVDLLGMPVDIGPESDLDAYQKALEQHPWTRWKNKMKDEIIHTDLVQLVRNKAAQLGSSGLVSGSVYFDKNGNLLTYTVSVPARIFEFLTEEQLEQYHAVCLNKEHGGKVQQEVLSSIFLRLSTEEFIESCKKARLAYQEKIKRGKKPYKGFWLDYMLPIEKRPKSDYGVFQFMEYFNLGNNIK